MNRVEMQYEVFSEFLKTNGRGVDSPEELKKELKKLNFRLDLISLYVYAWSLGCTVGFVLAGLMVWPDHIYLSAALLGLALWVTTVMTPTATTHWRETLRLEHTKKTMDRLFNKAPKLPPQAPDSYQPKDIYMPGGPRN